MIKVLCVIRVSTVYQEIESQKSDMTKYLLSLGYESSDIDWLESKGASARSLNKTYLDMIDEIKERCKTIKTIAVWHLNRLGRVESKLMELKEYFILNHIQVLVKNPSITLLDDDNKPNAAAEISWSIFATMVKFDTEELMEKFARGKAEARKQGKYVGGVISFGFKRDKDNFIVIDEDKVPTIIHAYKMYINGSSRVEIKDYFWSMGYNFAPNHVKVLMGREEYKQIIGEELWEQYNKIRKERGGEVRKARKYHICEGLIICPKCGRHFYKHGNTYRCVSNMHIIKGTDKYCDCHISLTMGRIDCMAVESAWVWYNKYTLKNGSQRADEVRRLLTDLPKQINATESKLEGIQGMIERVAEAYIDGSISKSKKEQKMNDINNTKKDLENQLVIQQQHQKDLLDELKLIESMKTTSQSNSDAVDKMTHIEIYELVHKFVKKITIHEDENEKYTRVIQVYSKLYYDMIVYKTVGIGNGYRLYKMNGLDWIDITRHPRYKKEWTLK